MAKAAIVAATAAAVFINGLYGDWLDDDPLAITDNPDVNDDCGRLSNWSGWTNDFWGIVALRLAISSLAPPLTILSFRFQRCVLGLQSVSFHAVNVALHCLVSALLCLACRHPVLPYRGQRTLIGLLFAVHAVHVECVTNTVGRSSSSLRLASFAQVYSTVTLSVIACGGCYALAACLARSPSPAPPCCARRSDSPRSSSAPRAMSPSLSHASEGMEASAV